ncbi:MAG: class I SAM-dependent methyltransferase, partial [Dehalococcoidia bacterium]|nr:class I SAM-dependent methyltransferase [Dehalococcoidia bacterium]
MQELARGLSNLGMRLTSSQAEQFETYYRELVEWNGRMNLTSITDYGEVQIKHFL